MGPRIPKAQTIYRRSPGPSPYHLLRQTPALPSPLPPTSLLIKVHVVSLNYRDANILNGTNPWPVLEAGIPCSDAAGEIIATGDHVTRFAVGERVCPILDQRAITGDEQERSWLGGDVDGVLADYVLVDEQVCVKIPTHLTWAEAACLPNAGVTAWSSLASPSERKLVSGQTVLLQGTGGVSIMALKLAWAAGCKVIITSSSDEKLDQIKRMAEQERKAVETINYKTTPAWDEEALCLNGGRGVDIVLENGGTPSTLQSLRAVKKGGMISQVGYLGKQSSGDLECLIPRLIDKTANFRGINVGSRLDFENMNRVIEASRLRFDDVIDRRFSFWEAKEAFEYLWSGKHVGKIVIEVA